MKTSLLRTLIVGVASFFISTTANAGLIDFETVLGGTPVDGQSISTQFLLSDGVSFLLENGDAPVLAQVGGIRTAFKGPGVGNAGNDKPAAIDAPSIGQFFLTDDGETSGTTASPLIVTYATPTASASGVILDIDSQETFKIEAFDGLGGSLGVINFTAGTGDTGNGIASNWSFNLTSADISSIKFTGLRNSNFGFFGLGFDNFDTGVTPSVVPLPATLPLYGTGLALMGFIGWRRKQRKVV